MTLPIEIPLTQGYVTMVDPCDMDLLDYKWTALVHPKARTVYAIREEHKNGKTFIVWMHRVVLARILSRTLTRKEETDHIDRNGLNNQRFNLRLADRAQNNRNTSSRQRSTSSYKGVSLGTRDGLWCAQIGSGGRNIYLGRFNTEVEAAIVYNHAAKDLFGDFAFLNNIPDWEHQSPAPVYKSRTSNASGYRGVHKSGNRWKVEFVYQGKHIYAGCFTTPELAYDAYREVAKGYFGNLARLD